MVVLKKAAGNFYVRKTGWNNWIDLFYSNYPAVCGIFYAITKRVDLVNDKINFMWNRLFSRRNRALQSIFSGHYVEVKAFYAFEFGSLCNVSFIGDLENSAAFTFISETLHAEIISVYQHIYFDHSKKDLFFNNTIFVLSENRMIELAGNYCQVLHSARHNGWARELLRTMSAFRMVTEVAPVGFAWQANEN